MRLKEALKIIQGTFSVHELVSKRVYDLCGEESVLLINPILLQALVALKKAYPGRKIIVNDWFWGGIFDGRGYRDSRETTGDSGSPHRRGEAIDCIVDGVQAVEVRQYIKDHPSEFPGIKRLEKNVTWLHMDTIEKKGVVGIYEFNP